MFGCSDVYWFTSQTKAYAVFVGIWSSDLPSNEGSGYSLGERARPFMLLGNDGVRPVADLRQINLPTVMYFDTQRETLVDLAGYCAVWASRISHGHVGVVVRGAIIIEHGPLGREDETDEKMKRTKEWQSRTRDGGKAGERSQGGDLLPFKLLFQGSSRQWGFYCIWIHVHTRSSLYQPCKALSRGREAEASHNHGIANLPHSRRFRVTLDAHTPTPCSGRLLGTCTRYLEQKQRTLLRHVITYQIYKRSQRPQRRKMRCPPRPGEWCHWHRLGCRLYFGGGGAWS
jgi:hypothetical protein